VTKNDNLEVSELSEEDLTNKYLTLGKIFEEIISFSEAALYIQAHFDINVDTNSQRIEVIKVPDNEASKRITDFIMSGQQEEPRIIAP
jgi:uncharacterized protein YpiB (UPF0302 family)